MGTRHLVDRELLAFLDQNPTQVMSAERLARLRSTPLPRPGDGLPAGLSVEERFTGHGVRMLVTRPLHQATPLPVVIHIHGGGYMVGSPDESQPENAALSLACACVVVSVDYRLAPEWPYPAALDDCESVLDWVVERAAELRVDVSRIVLKGESAGGGLATCLALRLRRRPAPPRVALLVLVAPMLDCDVHASRPEVLGEFVWTAASNLFAWRAYLGPLHGLPDLPEDAAAAGAHRLDGLPPTFLSVGALDLFLQEDVDFAMRLNRAGIATELHVYPGAFHSFHRAGDTALRRRLRGDYQLAIARAMG
jgi:acetyl esterase/lipase